MSLGYADKLKRRKNLGGQLGATEYFDSVKDVENKMKNVAELVR
jgi:mono-ADP-ribosyltransferase sirtuin 6